MEAKKPCNALMDILSETTKAQQFQLYVPKSPRHQPGVTWNYVDLPGRNVVGKGNSSKGHWE